MVKCLSVLTLGTCNSPSLTKGTLNLFIEWRGRHTPLGSHQVLVKISGWIELIFVIVIWILICWVGSYLDIALNLSTSSWLSVDSPLFSREPWLLEKLLLEKWRAGANLERIGYTNLFEGGPLYLLPPLSKMHLPNRVIEVNISER